jgi:trans-aconitate 2-methyltransferase
MPTWDANQYLRFNEERTRPCRELAARIRLDREPARVIDLGCGPGNSTAVLAERWPQAALAGFDSSPEMIAAARRDNPRLEWNVGDIAAWAETTAPTYDIVFSNAALQWVPHHAAVLPKLLRRVAPSGALAVQVPANIDAPAHVLMREMAASSTWRGFLPQGVREWHVETLEKYYDILAPFAATLDIWETEYQHIMPDAAAIVDWYKGTGLRPFLDALPNEETKTAFTAGYLERIRRAYPSRPDGNVLFPFRRLFIIAHQRPV